MPVPASTGIPASPPDGWQRITAAGRRSAG